MKSKTIPLVFLVIAVLLAGVFILTQKIFKNDGKSLTRAKIITPKNSYTGEGESDGSSANLETEKFETFVPLRAGETLIGTLALDFSNDGYEDEVLIVRKNTSQNLVLIPGLYDPDSGNYTRLEEITTQFTRSKALSYSGMDLTGDHKNSLIYQGVDDTGNYVMEVFLFNESASSPKLLNIGKFYSDGTVFIQQTERSESYEFSLSKGESYSIWVYKSDRPEEGKEDASKTVALNQIQQEYKWNPVSSKYELAREIKITAGRLAANELSRIQDGTVETFAGFLNGLWYKTSNTGSNVRYMFFDFANGEIIQLYDDIQEVYEWQDSKLRHNGIYLTTINSDIRNFHRRFDIALTAVDEIRVTLRDDVNLIIKESTMWDGQYKKMGQQGTFAAENSNEALAGLTKALKSNGSWTSADSITTIAFDDFTYTLQNSDVTESGIYSTTKIGNYNVIQFRSDNAVSVLNEAYAMEFGTKVISETVKRKTVEKVVDDTDTIIFSPVKITPTDCFATEGKTYTFTR